MGCVVQRASAKAISETYRIALLGTFKYCEVPPRGLKHIGDMGLLGTGGTTWRSQSARKYSSARYLLEVYDAVVVAV
eukprot:1899111-Rhodomonas_salina.2